MIEVSLETKLFLSILFGVLTLWACVMWEIHERRNGR